MEPIGLSIEETCKYLGGLSKQTIYRMIGRGELEAIKIGTRTLVTTSSIKSAVENAERFVYVGS